MNATTASTATSAAALLAALALTPAALADNWTMNVAADNFHNVYFGTPTTTTFYAGGSSWPTPGAYTALSRPPTDFLYVQCHSDYATGQGFLGTFNNTTLGQTVNTDLTNWDVFPAGAYLPQLGYAFSSWPIFQTPTQAQVDAAILYATTNSLWVAPSGGPGYFNTAGSPLWGPISTISPSAQWIWYNSNSSANPLIPGFNHDEFLIFRFKGFVPAPGSLALLAAGGMIAGRRRR